MWCMYHHERPQYNGDLHRIPLCGVCTYASEHITLLIVDCRLMMCQLVMFKGIWL
mgnify:FL=1